MPDLTGIPLQNLQVNLHKMKYLIIDEISMVGAKFFHLIDRRLRQAYGKPSTTFGGCNLILVGDPKQLPPVCDTEIYEKRTRNTGEKALLGMAAFDEIERVIVLTQMMRQNDPKQEQFRNLLNRLRVGESTKDDYNLLKTRFFSTVSNNERNEFEEATRLYPTRRQVREHNLDKLARLNTGGSPQKTCRLDATHTPTHLSAVGRKQSSDDMMGLESSLYVARGARIMITQNVWTEMGLTNGCTGFLRRIIFEENTGPPGLPIALIIEMDHGWPTHYRFA